MKQWSQKSKATYYKRMHLFIQMSLHLFNINVSQETSKYWDDIIEVLKQYFYLTEVNLLQFK